MLKRALNDGEQEDKSPGRSLQLVFVSCCGEDIQIFAIAAVENLFLYMLVLLFSLHSGLKSV